MQALPASDQSFKDLKWLLLWYLVLLLYDLCHVLNCWDGVRSTASPSQPHPHLWTTAPCDHNWFLASLLACARFCLPSLSPPSVTFPSQFGEVFSFKQTNAIELKFPQAFFAIHLQTFSNKVRFLCHLLQSSSTGNCFRFYLLVKMWSTHHPPTLCALLFQLQVAFVKFAIAPIFTLLLGRNMHTLSSITWTLNSQVKHYPDDLLCTPFISDSKHDFFVELLQDWINIGTFGLVCCWSGKFIGEETYNGIDVVDLGHMLIRGRCKKKQK